MAISLSVHRNKVESKRKRDLAKHAQTKIEAIIREQDIRAFAFVGISAKGEFFASWDTGAIMPLKAFPATIFTALSDDIVTCGVKDDWKPNLTLKGGIQSA